MTDLRAAYREACRMRGDGPVAVAWLSRTPEFAFMGSMLELWESDLARRRIHVPGGGRIAMQSSPRIAEARSQLVDHFLTDPGFNGGAGRVGEWLLMVDDDMTFDADDVAEVLECAHPDERPIVGGLCFGGTSRENSYPTLYAVDQVELKDDDGEPAGLAHSITRWETDEIPAERLVKVGATGAAFLLVHRKVLLTMRKAYYWLPDGRQNPYTYFAEGLVDAAGRPLGEDTAFCIRARALGFPVHVATGVNIGHVKTDVLTRDKWEALHGAD